MERSGATFTKAYERLNKAQKAAVDTTEGPVMVIAGPGSGKTEILALRVANILQKTQATPGNILCLTFTESAASNMRQRLATLIGEKAYRVAIHTFHSFATEVIGRYPEYFYGGAYMSPADDLIRLEIIENALRDLPHGHPLRSEHPEQGYVFRKPVLKVIGFFKKAGLMPDELGLISETNEKDIEALDPIIAEYFGDRISKKEFGKIHEALLKIEVLAKKAKTDLVPHVFWKPYSVVVASSLKKALMEAQSQDSGTPLSTWKSDWSEKGDDGKRHLKDGGDRLIRMKEVATIYAHYQKELFARGYFDFDDMILDVIEAALTHTALRSELQEMYQYMLVDEFQDTNDAQMRLVRIIADAEVNEQKPNLMVVGDDDQAIYRFQGADVSNILSFATSWKDVAFVTMTDNYRSTQDILDAASSIIGRGSERLEKILPNIEKKLVSANKNLSPGEIKHICLPTSPHEYHFVAKEIRRLIDGGTKPEEIAVIARKHRQLEDLVSYLKAVSVPVRYEREQNVLLEPHIKQIITIGKFLQTVADVGKNEADYLLPEILSFPFWGVSRIDIWKVGTLAAKNHETWLAVMLSFENKAIREIAEFLIDLSLRAKNEPLEQIIDRAIGAHAPIVLDSDEDEITQLKIKDNEFLSPFKSFYFSKDRFLHARADYLSFLSSLRTFINALREYKRGKTLSLADLVEFVVFREKNDLPLNDFSPFANAESAVSLLSAHKAKGLEFDTVFVLSCLDSIWVGRGEPKRLILPANIPIEPAGDNEDDKLRLFYVALTRAKRHLYLTSYESKDEGGNVSPLRFLLSDGNNSLGKVFTPVHFALDVPDTSEVLEASWLSFHTPPYRGEEEALLKNLLKDYKLSVTHLNNFLDVAHGGPQKFIENNLLRFPQAKTASSAYGSAVHEALSRIVVAQKQDGKKPSVKKVEEWFLLALTRERLPLRDIRVQSERGKKSLTTFYEAKKSSFSPEDLVEVDFKSQGVVIGGAHITGKIDRITKADDGSLIVRDYKTGRPLSSWEKGSDDERQKLRTYQRQLFFYKLLLKNSRDFSNAVTKQGVIEFIEPEKGTLIDLTLTLENEQTKRLQDLVSLVFSMIVELKFPSIKKYSPDLKGVIDFEEDILKGTCVFE